MIKAEVNVTGTVSRNAAVRTDKSGNPFMAFAMNVTVKGYGNETKTVMVYVIVPNGQQSDLAIYTEGKRITVNGTMDIHKKNEDLTFFLAAKYIATEGIAELDAINGTMSFRGHLKKAQIFEEKQTKVNQKPYIRFSAYSSEKDGNDFVSTWVNFMRFPSKDQSIDTIKEDWFQPKAHIQIRGTLEFDVFKGKLSINSRVLEISPYVKPENQ